MGYFQKDTFSFAQAVKVAGKGEEGFRRKFPLASKEDPKATRVSLDPGLMTSGVEVIQKESARARTIFLEAAKEAEPLLKIKEKP